MIKLMVLLIASTVVLATVPSSMAYRFELYDKYQKEKKEEKRAKELKEMREDKRRQQREQLHKKQEHEKDLLRQKQKETTEGRGKEMKSLLSTLVLDMRAMT